ncbi:hypothetical protein NA57DRAFT_18840, partial [Rhizodiscina lignyota]
VEKRRVYLACRAIFAGGNAQVRKAKKIRELVDEHKKALSPLIRDYGVDKVAAILKKLLEQGIFQFQVKAKIEFPELFQSSPARDVQLSSRIAPGRFAETKRSSDPAEPPFDNMPSLYPSYLPYRAQHLILTAAQRVLEECCFKFAETWLSPILIGRGWDCPEAVELTKWTRILAKPSASTNLPTHALKLDGSRLQDVLFATNKLRHTAVHRLPTTARGITHMIESALKLAEALQDPLRTAQLEELHYEIDSKIKAMELDKNVLENDLTQKLKEIRRQREELDREEKDAVASVVRRDLENKSLIGILLEESVKNIFA